jgi:multicomponent Na+:H+ antiporter subunit D
VSDAWQFLGLNPLMVTARFWSWFDWHGIDGVVDGTARCVQNTGGELRRVQSGQMQYNIFYAAAIAAVLIVVYYAAG